MIVDMLKLQMDFIGARTELAMTLLGGGLLSHIAPTTDQPLPVITLPGFLASDASLSRLNRFLNRQGFNAHSWGLGRNLGPKGQNLDMHLDTVGRHLMDRVKKLADATSRPVSLVGQSLGGVYARELAMRLDGEIDRVIMLGSPTFHPYKAERHNRVIGTFGYWINRTSAAEFSGRKGLLHWDADHPDIPCVAIHSPVDGIVNENDCHIPDYIVQQSPHHAPRENIRILSSHIGMSVSPWVLLAVADRLLADRDDWRDFDPLEYFPDYFGNGLSLVYPNSDWRAGDGATASMIEMNP